MVGQLGFFFQANYLTSMHRLFHPCISWLLVAIFAAGHVPALVHRTQCSHGCEHSDACDADQANTCEHDHASTCDRVHAAIHQPTELAAGCAVIKPFATNHDCENCLICRSLQSVNGAGLQSNLSIVSGVTQTSLLLCGPAIPELHRFGISQSRAPPQRIT